MTLFRRTEEDFYSSYIINNLLYVKITVCPLKVGGEYVINVSGTDDYRLSKIYVNYYNALNFLSGELVQQELIAKEYLFLHGFGL